MGRFSPPAEDPLGAAAGGPVTPGLALAEGGISIPLAHSSSGDNVMDDVDAAVSFAAASVLSNVNIREKRLTNTNIAPRPQRPPVSSFSYSAKEDDSIQTTVSPREGSAKLVAIVAESVAGGSLKTGPPPLVVREEEQRQQ